MFLALSEKTREPIVLLFSFECEVLEPVD
jgi:hypothetical protein